MEGGVFSNFLLNKKEITIWGLVGLGGGRVVMEKMHHFSGRDKNKLNEIRTPIEVHVSRLSLPCHAQAIFFFYRVHPNPSTGINNRAEKRTTTRERVI